MDTKIQRAKDILRGTTREPTEEDQDSINKDSDSSFKIHHVAGSSQSKINDPVPFKLGERSKKGIKYAKITDHQREALIERVMTTGCTIKSASIALQINFSTAKAIMQIYRREGRSSKKTIRKNRKMRFVNPFKKEEFSQIEQDVMADDNLQQVQNYNELNQEIVSLKDQLDLKEAQIQTLNHQNTLYQTTITSTQFENYQLKQKLNYFVMQFSMLGQMPLMTQFY